MHALVNDMKRVKQTTKASKERLLSLLYDSDRVNRGAKFNDAKGIPHARIKTKGDMIKIKCEMVGGASKDNGFLEGTYFIGKLREHNGTTSISGFIFTAPIYHSILIVLFAYYLGVCISVGGFHPMPILALIFSIFLFKNEFAKQGIIEWYIKRAVKLSSMN